MAAQPVVTGALRPFIRHTQNPEFKHLPFAASAREAVRAWSPARTGREVEDAVLGSYYALEYLQFLFASGANGWLVAIVEAMPRKLGAVEINFLENIERAALAGARINVNQEVQS